MALRARLVAPPAVTAGELALASSPVHEHAGFSSVQG